MLTCAGGALGSVVGQLLPTTKTERVTLLAAGSAAGLSAAFSTPLSAILIALELLIHEYKATSLLAIGVASFSSAALRLEIDLQFDNLVLFLKQHHSSL